MSDDKELYTMLGKLVQGNEDIKDEMAFIHKAIVEKDNDIKEIDKRLQNVEKRQYSLVLIATAAWTLIVYSIKKYL